MNCRMRLHAWGRWQVVQIDIVDYLGKYLYTTLDQSRSCSRCGKRQRQTWWRR